MKSLLEQLENNEAVLLMYLADELPADDRLEVQHMLENDESLRSELSRLAMAQKQVDGLFARADSAEALPVSAHLAERNVMRTIDRWNTQRLSAPAAATQPVRRILLPWWCYPIAAAASVLIVFLVWWGNQDGPAIQNSTVDIFAYPNARFVLNSSFDDSGEIGTALVNEAVSVLNNESQTDSQMLLDFGDLQGDQ